MTAVIFDIGGVLIRWAPERAFEQVMPADEVRPFMEQIGFDEWNRTNDGLRSIAGSEAALAERFPDHADGIRAYRQHFLHTVTQMVPGTGAVLAELNQAGVTTIALTNWAADMFAIARERFGILARFSDIVVSGEEGIVKPDPAIYALACRRAGVEPDQAIFIDDSPPNASAATDAGLTGLTFTSAEQLRADLVGAGHPRRTERRSPSRSSTGRRVRSGKQPLPAATTRGRAVAWDYLAEGFVHFSFEHQLAATRARFYADLAPEDLTLLRLDPDPHLPIVVEDGFPHLFAELPVSRVQASAPA